MTRELEQKFYDTFGIEPEYPNITAEKLLQLLCIVIDVYNRDGYTFYLDSTNVKELKEEILDALMGCIDVSCDLFEIEVKQIQELFDIEEINR